MTDETLPEPDGYRYWSVGHSARWTYSKTPTPDSEPLYTAATLRQAVKRARQLALEEAANLCDEQVDTIGLFKAARNEDGTHYYDHEKLDACGEAMTGCADRIRRLLEESQ